MTKNFQSNESPTGAGYQAPAVQKAFQILETIAGAKKRMGLSELAAELGYSKSTTHGLVHALLREGALVYNSKGKKLYLGPTIVDLAFRGWNYIKISNRVQPILDGLRDSIGETVFLGVLRRTIARAVIMATAEAQKPMKISSPPGTSLSLLAGAVGKVFLADMTAEDAENLLRTTGLPKFTDQSITSEKEYLAQLASVRDLGYAIDKEEYLPGVKAVAVSLGNIQGLPMAVWVVGFTSAMSESAMPAIIEETLKTARKLNEMLEEDA